MRAEGEARARAAVAEGSGRGERGERGGANRALSSRVNTPVIGRTARGVDSRVHHARLPTVRLPRAPEYS